MPEISRFFGIVIAMYYNDHNPPHFHVRYAEEKATVTLDPISLLEGKLPPRVYGLTVEWALQHQDELQLNWQRARNQEPLLKIPPLQ